MENARGGKTSQLLGLLFGTRVFYLLIAAPASYFFWHRKGSFNVTLISTLKALLGKCELLRQRCENT